MLSLPVFFRNQALRWLMTVVPAAAWPLSFSLCYKKLFPWFSKNAVAHTATVSEADNATDGVLCKTSVSIPEKAILLMEISLPRGSLELWKQCLGCFCGCCAAGVVRRSFSFPSLHSGSGFSPSLLGCSCVPVPHSADLSHRTHLDKK